MEYVHCLRDINDYISEYLARQPSARSVVYDKGEEEDKDAFMESKLAQYFGIIVLEEDAAAAVDDTKQITEKEQKEEERDGDVVDGGVGHGQLSAPKRRNCIILTGNIGAGKSTACHLLGEYVYDTLPIPEGVDKWVDFHGINALEYLYQKKITPYEFSNVVLQTSDSLVEVTAARLNDDENVLIMDRCVIDTLIFSCAAGLADRDVYMSNECLPLLLIVNSVLSSLKGCERQKADADCSITVVYLSIDVDICMENIVKRNRFEECGGQVTPKEYLTKLQLWFDMCTRIIYPALLMDAGFERVHVVCVRGQQAPPDDDENERIYTFTPVVMSYVASDYQRSLIKEKVTTEAAQYSVPWDTELGLYNDTISDMMAAIIHATETVTQTTTTTH